MTKKTTKDTPKDFISNYNIPQILLLIFLFGVFIWIPLHSNKEDTLVFQCIKEYTNSVQKNKLSLTEKSYSSVVETCNKVFSKRIITEKAKVN